MLHYDPQHVSSSTLLILMRTNCITTASGIVTLCKQPYSMQVESGPQSALHLHTVQLKDCLCSNNIEHITDDTKFIERDFTCIPRNDLFLHLLCAKLVGTNSDMHALTFQRKDDTETWIHSLPSHFRPDRVLFVTASSLVGLQWMCSKLWIWLICTVYDLKLVFILVSLA